MLAIKRSHIRLLVVNFKSCFCFYRDKLGLPVRYGQEDSVYAEFKTPGLHLALFKRQLMAEVLGRQKNPLHSEIQDPQVIVLRVDNLDMAFAFLKGRGVCFETEPVNRVDWNCRTAHFRDPDGNVWELNADL